MNEHEASNDQEPTAPGVLRRRTHRRIERVLLLIVLTIALTGALIAIFVTGQWIATPFLIPALIILSALFAPDLKTHAEEAPLARVCASCSYDLRGLPADHVGQTVCPECGAVWHLPDRDITNTAD